MPKDATIGRLLLEDAVPPDLHAHLKELNAKQIRVLAQALAENHPDKYKDVIHKLTNLASQAGYESGSYSFGPEHMRGDEQTLALRNQYRSEVAAILNDPTLNDKLRNDKLVQLALKYKEPIEKSIFGNALAAGNPLALQVESGAKGKPDNLKSLTGGDSLYADSKFQIIPYPIVNSFYEGLAPHEYFAGSFGARQSIITTKLGTAKGGWLSKRMANLAHRLVVTAKDDENDKHAGAIRGYETSLDDADNEGAALAAPIGGYKRNDILSREVIANLKKQGIKDVLVRSPTVGGPDNGGVYGFDVGVRERNGKVSPVGDYVGLGAAQSLSEPATQLLICLAEGTEVRMADKSIKAIEDIQLGDLVLGIDMFGGTFPVRVTATWDNGLRECARTTLCNEQGDRIELVSTYEHKVLAFDSDNHTYTKTPVDFKEPWSCVPVFTKDGKPSAVYKRTGQQYIGPLPTYDLEVEHPDHLFVLANGLAVENSSKHQGGVAGATKGQEGFPTIDRLLSIPEEFTGGATHALHDGRVDNITQAPQGGHYIHVKGVAHYVPPDYTINVKVGDPVEAGDPMTDGIPNPALLTEHKHIGEARKRFVDTFMNVATNAGFKPHRRNVELIATGLINHVRLEQEMDSHAPGDVVSYSHVENHYTPRDDHEVLEPKRAVGKYLEAPVLHYTIGTRIKPSMLPLMSKYGVTKLTVHNDPPPFTPVMIRSHDTPSYDEDWTSQMLGSGLEKSLLSSVHRGAVADPYGTSYVPALVQGVDFGTKGKSVGFDPKDVQNKPG